METSPGDNATGGAGKYSEYEEVCADCGQKKFRGVPCRSCEEIGRNSGAAPANTLLNILAFLSLLSAILALAGGVALTVTGYVAAMQALVISIAASVQCLILYALLKGMADVIRMQSYIIQKMGKS